MNRKQKFLLGDRLSQQETQIILQTSCCCSFAKSCPTPCHPMNCSTPGFPILYYPWVCSKSCPLSQWYLPMTIMLCDMYTSLVEKEKFQGKLKDGAICSSLRNNTLLRGDLKLSLNRSSVTVCNGEREIRAIQVSRKEMQRFRASKCSIRGRPPGL